MAEDRTTPVAHGLARLRDDLRRRSHLFEDPRAYQAGVDDAVEALSAGRSDETARVARVRASALGFATAADAELDAVAELDDLAGSDPVTLLRASRQLDTLVHLDRGMRGTANGLLLSALARSPRHLEHDHDVTFYRDATALGTRVAAFLAPALTEESSTTIVVATPEHHECVLDALRRRGITQDLDGSYLALDAETLLAELMVGGRPDRARFHATVLPRVTQLRPNATEVRIYGEMVSLLWAQGNCSAAIELETLWNEAAQRTPFRLLCGYPMHVLDAPEQASALRDVCHRHRQILPTAS